MKDVQHIVSPTTSGSRRSGDVARHSGMKIFFAGALSVAVLLIAGCGSESGTSDGSGSPVAAAGSKPVADTSGVATVAKFGRPKTVVGARSHRKVAATNRGEPYAPPRITTGRHVQRPARGTGGSAINDDNPSARGSRADSGRPTTAGVPNPCLLVSRARAQAITTRAVTVTEAPLGPTCIYSEAGAKRGTTLGIEVARFTALTAHIKGASKFTVQGRPAVCASYGGGAVTYVGLPGTRVLNVSAPCEVGGKFAAAALAKLGY